ncbi:MAG: hypothetical protein M3042_06505 [Actinomycetota bacterium]|nr:hypothetical protein [Actinomycetota bacterium]
MGWRQELAEPWGIVAAGIVGGLGWAVAGATTPAIAVGVGVGAAVYGVKVATATLTHRGARSTPSAGLLRPHKGSPADVWLRRAEQTVRTLHQQTESPREAAVRAQVGDIDDEAAVVVGALRRLATQVTAVEDALAQIDVPRLWAESRRLGSAGGADVPAQLRAEQERSQAAIHEQLDVAARLTEARATLLAKMQSTVIGLEGLVARLAEVLALSTSAGGVDTAQGQIGELTSELDGLRSGLAETEAVSRQALGQRPVPPATA